MLENIVGTLKVAHALATSLLELGLMLLAIVTLFMPRRCSELLVRRLTWLSTCLRCLRKGIDRKRWE